METGNGSSPEGASGGHGWPRPERGVAWAAGTARVLGAAAAVIGAAYLAFWAGGLPVRWAARGIITMKTNMALAQLLAGTALVLLARRPPTRRDRAVGLAAAATVTVLGTATLAEHLTGVDLRIDQLLAREPPGAPGTSAPNRMGIPGSVNLTLIGTGLLLLGARRRGSALAGAAAFCVALFPAVGVLYGAGLLRAVPGVTGIAGPTVLGLLCLSVGLSLAPSGDAVPLLWRADPGGLLLRRLVVPAVVLPVGLGFLRLEGERRGLFGTAAGTGIFAAVLAAVFLLLVWRSAVRISASASARLRALHLLRGANAALRQADRRKDEFLSVLSHELRNPLAPIQNSVFILERADPASAQAARARGVVKRQVTHLTRLVDDLLDVTRIARGKVQLRRSAVDLRDVVARAAEDHRAMIEAAGIALEVRTPPEPVPVDADEARITQIVGNLLQNARKFTDAGGRVALAVAAEGDAATIRVRDSGAGIDPELAPHLFEPFAQAKQTLARSEGGLGLGLALVKGLAELHGGRVSAASSGPGAGSEFTVELPLLRAAPVAAVRDGVPPARSGRRVLVVDDNADAAESLAELVRLFGHDVEVAYDGPSAVAKVAATRPQVVLCDLGLPGMSGYEVARALRASGDVALRLVAVSGYAQPDDVRRCREAGFDAHLAKPPDPDRVERLLD